MTGRAMQSPGDLPAVATGLGRLGLIPFVALAAGVGFGVGNDDLLYKALAAYSFGILAFLLGAWWGLALIRRQPSALLLSNAIFLVVFFSYLGMGHSSFFILAAVVFLLLLVIERRHPLFRQQPDYYARMRAQLSVTAALALLFSAGISG